MLSQVYTYVVPQFPGLGEVCKLNKLPNQGLALAGTEQAEAEIPVRAQRYLSGHRDENLQSGTV